MRNDVIEIVKEKDLEYIYKLYKEIFKIKITLEELRLKYNNIIKNENIKILAYYINDIPVGTVQICIDRVLGKDKAVLWNVCVEEKYRRRKIATNLLLKCEQIIKEEYNVNSIWLFSGFYRKNAHKFYKKLGYNENRDKGFVKFI